MKKFLLFIWIAVSVWACKKQPDNYELKINIENGIGNVYLQELTKDGFVSLDSVAFNSGVAIFNGKLNYPREYYLTFPDKSFKQLIFLENANVTVFGNMDSLQNVEINGSDIHDEYAGVAKQLKEKREAYLEFYKQARNTGDKEEKAKLMEEVDALVEAEKALQGKYISQHPASVISPYFLSKIYYDKDAGELEKILDNFDPILKDNYHVQKMRIRVEGLKTVAIGEAAPDFIQNDVNGVPVKFSDVYTQNRYTLVDFWASWCNPCRAENPNVVAVYRDYQDRGLGIIGVSLDKSKGAWLEAIEQDNLTWIHVSDLQSWKNEVAREYWVNSIPANILVDKNGVIVAKNLQEEALHTKMKELFQ